MGSFIVTFFSTLIAVPLGVLSAVYISEVAPKPVKEILKPLIELLAGIPSVVLGFFGMVVLAPWLQDTFDLPTGLNIVNASLMLALMAIPTISSIAEDALYAVPREFKEASYALGATKSETILKVIIPSALSGISTAVILGMARAIGETMVVLMVAGGAAAIPESLFDSVRPMPASIAAEMGEAPFRSEHYHALFATGIVLFLLTLAFNLIADYVSHRFRETGIGHTLRVDGNPVFRLFNPPCGGAISRKGSSSGSCGSRPSSSRPPWAGFSSISFSMVSARSAGIS